MSRPDRPVLRSHPQIHDVLLQATAQSPRNVHRKQTETPMSAAEFRYPLLSFCNRRGDGIQPSVRILTGKLGKMSIKEPLIDPRFYIWILGLGLNFFKTRHSSNPSPWARGFSTSPDETLKNLCWASMGRSSRIKSARR